MKTEPPPPRGIRRTRGCDKLDLHEKAVALAALRKREVVDNAIATQKGAKPYIVLNVELCDGVSDENGSSSYIGW